MPTRPPDTRTMPPSDPPAAELREQPGHLIRRAHQIAVSMFLESLGREITPVQYAVMRQLEDCPGLDQVSLAREVALDTSTTADIAARLESKGWIVREMLPRRQRRLVLTAQGEAVLQRLEPGIQRLQQRLLEPLDDGERAEFLRLLRKFVRLNSEQGRAPERSEGEG